MRFQKVSTHQPSRWRWEQTLYHQVMTESTWVSKTLEVHSIWLSTSKPSDYKLKKCCIRFAALFLYYLFTPSSAEGMIECYHTPYLLKSVRDLCQLCYQSYLNIYNWSKNWQRKLIQNIKASRKIILKMDYYFKVYFNFVPNKSDYKFPQGLVTAF